MCRCSERHVVAAVGVRLGTAASLVWTAFKATANLVQESRRGKTKHEQGPAAVEGRDDEMEMKSDGWARASMAECTPGLR